MMCAQIFFPPQHSTYRLTLLKWMICNRLIYFILNYTFLIILIFVHFAKSIHAYRSTRWLCPRSIRQIRKASWYWFNMHSRWRRCSICGRCRGPVKWTGCCYDHVRCGGIKDIKCHWRKCTRCNCNAHAVHILYLCMAIYLNFVIYLHIFPPYLSFPYPYLYRVHMQSTHEC